MSEHERLDRFLSEDCAECGTPGYQRHLSAVGGCGTCAAEDPRPVHVPVRGVYTYDGPLGFPPDTVVVYGGTPFPETVTPPWVPFRDRIPRAAKCYPLASGAMVHVKPDCRC